MKALGYYAVVTGKGTCITHCWPVKSVCVCVLVLLGLSVLTKYECILWINQWCWPVESVCVVVPPRLSVLTKYTVNKSMEDLIQIHKYSKSIASCQRLWHSRWGQSLWPCQLLSSTKQWRLRGPLYWESWGGRALPWSIQSKHFLNSPHTYSLEGYVPILSLMCVLLQVTPGATLMRYKSMNGSTLPSPSSSSMYNVNRCTTCSAAAYKYCIIVHMPVLFRGWSCLGHVDKTFFFFFFFVPAHVFTGLLLGKYHGWKRVVASIGCP